MKIVIISDTHNRHHAVSLPSADLLIHCGDIGVSGAYQEVVDFNEWLEDQDHIKDKVVIAGNHDAWIEGATTVAEVQEVLSAATYLQDSGCEVGGFKLWGSPWQPEFHNWSFNLPRGGRELKNTWRRIPNDTDILITHGPPHGILDEAKKWHPTIKKKRLETEHVGCRHMRDRVDKVKPKLHCFGHIHPGYGVYNNGDTTFVNASTCTPEMQPTNPPVILNL